MEKEGGIRSSRCLKLRIVGLGRWTSILVVTKVISVFDAYYVAIGESLLVD